MSRRRAVMVAHFGTASRIEDMATKVLDAAPPHFALAGVELGGMVAMDIIRRAPKRVTRLVLIGTTPLPESPEHAAAREPLIVAARTGRLGEVMDQIRPASALAPGRERLQIQALLREMALVLGPEIFAHQTRALQRRRDQQSTLRRMAQPVRVLCGEHDTIYIPKRHRFMAELIPNGTFELIEGAGHMPLLEQPDATVRALAAALGTPGNAFV